MYIRGFVILLASALGAIAIGVAVENTAAFSTYGPANAQFTASFPGPPQLLPANTNTGGPSGSSGILSYLHGSPRELKGVYNYRSSRDGEELTVTLVTTEAFVPEPELFGAPPIGNDHSIGIFALGAPAVTRPLITRPESIDHHMADVGVACLPPTVGHRNRACLAVLTGMRTATRTSITTWSAMGWAPTAVRALALVTSLHPLTG